MTNEGQYYSRLKTTDWDSIMDYGAARLREAWFKQAIFKQPVYYASADRIGMVINLNQQISDDYFAACTVQSPPTKILVSRRLYITIIRMPGFNENTNHLHFYHPYQLTADYKPRLDEPIQSVYVQIDPTRTDNEYFFQ